MKSGLYSYLSFNGNCREAMLFYQHCIGGKLQLQTIGESPLSEKMPKKMREAVLHCTLRNGTTVLMGTDLVNEELIKGNAVSLLLNCRSEKQLRSLYSKLSEGGEATYPPATTFYGAVTGSLKDKFGNRWQLHFAGNAGKN